MTTFFNPQLTPIFIPRLGLGIVISQILVTSLSMTVEIEDCSVDCYNALMCDILSFADIIAQMDCSIISWSMDVKVELTMSLRPLLESWRHLAEILRTRRW